MARSVAMGAAVPREAIRRADPLAGVALGGLVALGALLAVGTAARPSFLVPPSRAGFPDWLAGPFHGLASFLPHDAAALNYGFSGLLAAMLVCYVVVVARAWSVPVVWGLGAIGVLYAVFLLAPPQLYTDALTYLDYARLGALHGLNPYAHFPAAVPTDPTYAFSSWHHLVSPYGPAFTLLTYPLAGLGVPAAYWTLRAVTVAASLCALALVWRAAERWGRPPLPAVLLVGLNPLVLVYGVGGAHNDAFVVLGLAAGAAALAAGRPARGAAALVVAGAVKLSALAALPFALLGAERRRRAVVGAAVAAAAVAAVWLGAFGLHGPELRAQARLETSLSVQSLAGFALGLGGATDGVRTAFQVGLGVALLGLLVASWRGRPWLAMAGWGMLAVVVSLSWQMPWYVAWVLPLAALAGDRRLRWATVALSAYLLVALAPATGYLLDRCRCGPSHTTLGRAQLHEMRTLLH